MWRFGCGKNKSIFAHVKSKKEVSFCFLMVCILAGNKMLIQKEKEMNTLSTSESRYHNFLIFWYHWFW